MRVGKLQTIIAMILGASTLNARGIVCGSCPEVSAHVVVPLLPANSGGDAAAPKESREVLCARHCQDATSCVISSVNQADGTAIPVLMCSMGRMCVAGRRPVGMAAPREESGSVRARWLATVAHLEAASIDAFRLLRRDLAAHGAPRALLRAASRAARDERRHARRMSALARRSGAAIEAPRTAPSPTPDLESLASHNAVEGCVRETFGALVARYQATHAQDHEVAAALARIAAEEARHAALAFRIDAWARRRLDRAARARVDEARRRAAEELCAGVSLDASARADLGLPDPCVEKRLAEALIEALHLG